MFMYNTFVETHAKFYDINVKIFVCACLCVSIYLYTSYVTVCSLTDGALRSL